MLDASIVALVADVTTEETVVYVAVPAAVVVAIATAAGVMYRQKKKR